LLDLSISFMSVRIFFFLKFYLSMFRVFEHLVISFIVFAERAVTADHVCQLLLFYLSSSVFFVLLTGQLSFLTFYVSWDELAHFTNSVYI